VREVANLFGVKDKDVIDMEFRMASRDYSLDLAFTEDSSVTYLDTLSDKRANQQEVLESLELDDLANKGIKYGFEKLSPREQKVIESRYLKNPPEKLRELGEELGISKERVRQIEVTALKKLKGAVETAIS
jgi:RNA polymerase sigma-32 factor